MRGLEQLCIALVLTSTAGMGCVRPRPPREAPPPAVAPASPPASRPTSRPASRPASRPTSQPASRPAFRPAPVPTRAIRCGNPRGNRRLALTFDDGPALRFTPLLLDVLRRHKVRATFFVIGRLVRRFPRLVERLHREGHLVANHSFDHPLRASLAGWREQILRTERLIRAAGVPPAPYFRPPHGTVSPELLRLCHELGYSIVLYTLLSSDWERPGVAALIKQVTQRVAPGGIVVLHDAGGNRRQTLEALPGIIRGLRRRGYQLVTLDALLGQRPQPVRCARPGRPIPRHRPR